MKIKGLQKLTLLDYPGKVAATVFIGGCDFACPYCHNMDIVTDAFPDEYITEDYFFSFLKKRASMIDGICITGGEPLMSHEIEGFIKKIREFSLLVKLDTNGSYPDRLKSLVSKGLVDYVAMDIKNSPEKYGVTAVCPAPLLEKVKESVEFLKEGNVPFEFRTTAVKPFHTPDDFDKIGQWIGPEASYFIQCFTQRDAVPDKTLSAPDKEELERMLERIKIYNPHASIRGI